MYNESRSDRLAVYNVHTVVEAIQEIQQDRCVSLDEIFERLPPYFEANWATVKRIVSSEKSVRGVREKTDGRCSKILGNVSTGR